MGSSIQRAGGMDPDGFMFTGYWHVTRASSLPKSGPEVRVLILDHYYGAFVDEVYTKDPNLGQRSFEEQYEQLSLGLFGETEFQVSALRSLGHEALFLPVNVAPLLESWARAR